MSAPPLIEDDRLSKAALFSKFAESLSPAVHGWRGDGGTLLRGLLAGMRAVVGPGATREYHQGLFR